MKDSKKITISAVATALSVVLLIVGTFFPTFDLSCVFLCSIIIMLPLYKKTITGAFLSFIATSILASVLTFFRFNIIIPYVCFFGIHPIINEIQLVKKWNKWIMLLIKTIWFVGALFLMYFFTDIFVDFSDKIQKIIYYVLIIGGALFFIIYDEAIFYFRRTLEKVLKRIGV